jgi:TPR repeat protein
MRLLNMLLVLLVCAAVPAFAEPFEDAKAAHNSGDYATALRLYRALADAGDLRAQNNLGSMYANGQGVPQDYVMAVSLYRKAAEQGLASAQTNLGFLYEQGQGVPQDYAMAVSWYRKAAEQDQAAAQNNLGLMYERGQGVPQDYVLAHMWLNLAASRFKAPEGDRAIRNRDRVAAMMTPAQLAEAQKMAREWKPKWKW